MFRTDSKSLEQLSFAFDEKQFAHFRSILEYLKSNDLLTLSAEDVQSAFQGLSMIGKLKMECKIYAFHVDDTYAAAQSMYGEGVELRLRQGNALKEYLVPGNRDFVYTVDDALKFLRKKNISTIYTGEIPHDGEFLGLPYQCDDDDPLITSALREYEVEQFKSGGIQVKILDHLI